MGSLNQQFTHVVTSSIQSPVPKLFGCQLSVSMSIQTAICSVSSSTSPPGSGPELQDVNQTTHQQQPVTHQRPHGSAAPSVCAEAGLVFSPSV